MGRTSLVASSILLTANTFLLGCGGAPFAETDIVDSGGATQDVAVCAECLADRDADVTAVSDSASDGGTDSTTGRTAAPDAGDPPMTDGGTAPDTETVNPSADAGAQPDANPAPDAQTTMMADAGSNPPDTGSSVTDDAGNDAGSTMTGDDAGSDIDAAAYPYCAPGSKIIVVYGAAGPCIDVNGQHIVSIFDTLGPVCVVEVGQGDLSGVYGTNLEGRSITGTGNLYTPTQCNVGPDACTGMTVNPDSTGTLQPINYGATVQPGPNYVNAMYWNITAGTNPNATLSCW